MMKPGIKKVGHWWLPANEEMGLKWFEGIRGERPEVIDAAMKYVKDAGEKIALDVGAHVGTWTLELAKHFHHVHGFEPATPTWLALAFNLEERKVDPAKATPWPVAVGDRMGNCRPTVVMNASLSSHVDPRSGGRVPVIALDNVDWGNVGLIKIDVEGGEYFVLKGAARTIEHHHPVLVIEWKEGRLNRYGEYIQPIEALLNRWGYRLIEQLEIDRIYV